ncbi:hypothetical protein [Dyella sp. 20L07]|uniref:hypothetical protein n=1 Tax=Dyella sp. 20L07 TaxID=3384240 RepID=UPI003D283E0C
MARNSQPVRWYWPEMGNVADAEQASNAGVWAAAFCAAVTTIFATISVFTKSDVVGINPLAYVDAILFAIIAWGIRARYRAFAVIGLVLFVLEKIFQFATQPKAGVGIFLAIILLLAFISGVRGTFAYHRLRQAALLEATEPQDA